LEFLPPKLPRSGDGLERGRPARLCALGNRTSLEGTPRRVGEHLPNRFGVQFKLVRFYYAQRRAGRPRSSPLAASRLFLNARFGVQFQLVRFYYAQRRAGRPRSSPLAASRLFLNTLLAFSSNFFGSITHKGGRDARVPVRRRFAAIFKGTFGGRFDFGR
jgi:hypothetical protein